MVCSLLPGHSGMQVENERTHFRTVGSHMVVSKLDEFLNPVLLNLVPVPVRATCRYNDLLLKMVFRQLNIRPLPNI